MKSGCPLCDQLNFHKRTWDEWLKKKEKEWKELNYLYKSGGDCSFLSRHWRDPQVQFYECLDCGYWWYLPRCTCWSCS